MNGDFYIGYLDHAPQRIGRFIRRYVIALDVLAILLATVLVLGQGPFAPSRFEYGIERPFTGTIHLNPYPVLAGTDRQYLLVGRGKHGAGAIVQPFAGKHVTLAGSLIQRGADTMVEVHPGTVRELPVQATAVHPESAGEMVQFKGEIVDSKCYLGVMNPGEGKVHRSCAVRCISGGAQPLFIARDAAGSVRTMLLASKDGQPLNREILSFVAEPVIIRGTLHRAGSQWLFRADVSDIARAR